MYSKYIQWKADTNFDIGTNDQILGAKIGLYPQFGDERVRIWSISLDQNVILLEASGQSLAIDFLNGKVAPETPLVLSAFNGTPTPSQKWSFIARPGFITSLADPNLVIDDQGRGTNPGNPIWAYPFNGSIAQQWQAKDPFDVLAITSKAA